MQFKTIFRILGILLMIFSLSMVPPGLIALAFRDSEAIPFFAAFTLTLLTGCSLWLMFRNAFRELKTRDGFIVVVLFWFVLCFFAALPLMIAKQPHENFTDAMFESVSGFTTTGATVVVSVEKLSHAMRYYRQQLQFLGGMGIIVLAVAILPMLGIGGMQLFRAETPGPLKDSKLTPRITSTAKQLWYIYVGLTICCFIAYHFAGMSWFDALGESFATISTGGFTMHDSSFVYYRSSTIELIATFFMILGGINFALHFSAIQKRSLSSYWQDEEFRAYLKLIVCATLLVGIALIVHQTYQHPLDSLIKSTFNVVSLITTTGFLSGPFSLWPSFIPMLIMIVALIGGCAGSTSGGVKVIRVLLLKKQSSRELHRLIHPQAVINLKFNRQVMPEQVLQSTWSFIAAFISIFALLLLLLMALGLDLHSAVGSLVATMANAGVGIGDVATNFATLDKPVKWVLIFAMLAGRLEIFTLIVLFTPAFWRN